MPKEIKKIIFDVDGVFTNGQFIYDETGKRFKIFGPHDADGVKLLKAASITVSAITADFRGYSITKKRMDDMGIPLKQVSELDRLEFIVSQGHLDETCFMGDGHFDALVFDHVAYSIAPQNAVEIARTKANYVTNAVGGNGAVYEAAAYILKLNREN